MKKFTNRAAILLLFLWLIPQSASAARLLLPVGEIIGLKLADDTVTVSAFDDSIGAAAKNAGLAVGDRILKVDGKKITCVKDIRNALDRCDGSVTVSVMRKGKQRSLDLTPQITDDGPRLGVYLKEGTTGVGTVTFYDPDSGKFGALGHGVNDASGSLLQMREGQVYDASVVTVKKGKAGTPGQLMGALDGSRMLGRLNKNTAQGVFGILDADWKGQVLPVGSSKELHTGSAAIRCAVNGESVQEYSVEILKIYPRSGADGRNMLLRITDPALLNLTGGIVQGMSGSPIIQDGKLVGAVTHVLVNDPTTGYGIFIENMLDAAA